MPTKTKLLIISTSKNLTVPNLPGFDGTWHRYGHHRPCRPFLRSRCFFQSVKTHFVGGLRPSQPSKIKMVRKTTVPRAFWSGASPTNLLQNAVANRPPLSTAQKEGYLITRILLLKRTGRRGILPPRYLQSPRS